jgi:uncharacterized OB-fold protein
MANAPVPMKTTLTEPFYEAAADGRLLIQRCTRTGKAQWYPRGHSIHDARADVEWIEASGRGAVYTFTVVGRSPFDDIEAPYVLAIVELEEGPRMTTNIIGVDPEAVRIGMPVIADFEGRGDVSVVVFRPAEEA